MVLVIIRVIITEPTKNYSGIEGIHVYGFLTKICIIMAESSDPLNFSSHEVESCKHHILKKVFVSSTLVYFCFR